MKQEKKRFRIETFGCQMNVNDSEKIAGLLTAAGHEPAAEAEDADFVFVNTCAVRERAADKLYHQLGRLRKIQKGRPTLKIGVGGCVAQLEGDEVLRRAPYVDVLVGTHTLGRVPELLARAETGGPQVDLDRKADAFRVPEAAVAHSSTVRAFVTVMEGCNHVCSFCVVPRTRGPEVNRAADEIVAEVRSLVSRGYREVMLLGQTVDAYRSGDLDFPALLERVDGVARDARVRFTTSHPEHVTPRLADAMRGLPSVCPYLHLPVQSGSDRVLASMRRGYDRQRYLDIIALLRDRVPDLAISSDVIAGYPGETVADFEATVRLVEDVNFEGLFVFAYSPRPGTTARLLVDDVPPEEKVRRVRLLNELQQRLQLAANRGRIGARERVLVDSVQPGRISGRTPHFRIVHADGNESLHGRIVELEITGAGANSLQGRLREQPIH
ncbi:MAG TPA: tRNA (N6-isopentenyl adenosine(37)-C2)-methylthiotransferase MiaB [Vicinamibacteria bacterium]